VVKMESELDLGPDRSICLGTSLILDATVAGATSTLWSDGLTDPVRTITAAGTYAVEVTVGACVFHDTVEVELAPPPTEELDLGTDTLVCSATELVLDATVPGATSTLWENGSTDPLRTIEAFGTYTVAVTVGGCTLHDTIVVDMAPAPVLDLGPDFGLCAGHRDTVLVVVPPAATFSWDDGPVATLRVIEATGTYSATLTSACGTAIDSITVWADNCAPDIYLPNAFTPNADGVNDELLPVYDPRVWRVDYTVWDRWGRRMHGSSGSTPWSGEDVPNGIYVVQLEARSVSAPVTQRSLLHHVALVR
jgi:hypothetical protein